MKNEIHEIVLEHEINKPLAETWKVMVDRMCEWWPSDFLALEGARNIIFEP